MELRYLQTISINLRSINIQKIKSIFMENKNPENIEIAGLRFGNKQKAMLIAELSANHDQNLKQALSLVDIASEAGWDCIKLQTYNADSLSIPSKHPSMSVDAKWGKTNLYELYKSAAMPMEFHEPIFSKARSKGLIPFTSIYDPKDLDFTEKLDCEIYKIASFELTFDDLLANVSKTNKPIIISTGMANFGEIEHALEIVYKNGSSPVILLHCCSSYPAPLNELNLRAMNKMKQTFNKLIGFSDHTIGALASLTAVAMGAVAIEKHFTNDVQRNGPDHRFSATLPILKEISDGVKEIHLMKGSSKKHTTDAEKVSKSIGRRSAFAIKNLKAGDKISEKDFRFVRPAAGIPPTEKKSIIGSILLNNIPMGYPIKYDDIKND